MRPNAADDAPHKPSYTLVQWACSRCVMTSTSYDRRRAQLDHDTTGARSTADRQPARARPDRRKKCKKSVFSKTDEHKKSHRYKMLFTFYDGFKTVRPMLSDRCLSCLSVTTVYCGQTVGWIKMSLGREIGRGPGHIVLYGEAAPPRKGILQPPLFGPCLLWPEGRASQLLLSSCYIFLQRFKNVGKWHTRIIKVKEQFAVAFSFVMRS